LEGAPTHNTGGQPWYSLLAIVIRMTLQGVFRLALRQTEGQIGSIIHLLGLVLTVFNLPTLSRPAGAARGAMPATAS